MIFSTSRCGLWQNEQLSAAGLVSIVTGLASLIADFQTGGRPVIVALVTMVGGLGFLVLNQRLQPFVRFDQVRGDQWARGGTRDITFVGVNFYENGHSLKVQGDVRLQAGTGEALDGARVQAQMDF